MNKILNKTILVAFFLITIFAIKTQSAFAGTVFNTHPSDLPTIQVSNYTQNPGCTTCWSQSITAQPGDVVSVQVYYHNTGTSSAIDTKVKIGTPPPSATSSWSVNGGVLADGTPFAGGTSTININGSSKLTYIPGTTRWYSDQNFSNPKTLLNGQSGAEILTTLGLNIGTILPPSSCPGYPSIQFCKQGVVVARFQVSSNPVTYQCNDGIDNDGDGLVDYPSDPGCTSPTDNTEYNVITTYYQCNDGIDNDGDGLVDYPNDPGCTSPTDNTEYNVITTYYQCNDGIDNDGDGKVDYPTDPGCYGPTDNDEYNIVTTYYQCNDGYDNDSDGLVDYPNDPGCYGPTDNDESNIVNTLVSVTTNPATNIGNYGATLNGSYYSTNSYVSQTYFKYGTSYSLGSVSPYIYPNNYQGTMFSTLYNLYPGTTYYFQACATNNGGTNCGQVLSFFTPVVNNPNPPTGNFTVETTVATGINQTSAILNGVLTNSTCNNTSGSAVVWFEYGETQDLGLATGSISLSGGSVFYKQATGLKAGTTYYFRAVGQNSNGYGGYSCSDRGDIKTFTTSQKPIIIYQGGGTVINNIISSDSCMSFRLLANLESLTVGDNSVYTITYKNNCKSIVRNAIIVVEIPQEIIFKRSSSGIFADSRHSLTIMIGTILPKDEGTIIFEGTPSVDALKRDTLVTTGHMTYSFKDSNIQHDELAYAIQHVLGANGTGSTNGNVIENTTNSSFIPNSLILWLVAIFMILLLVVVVKKINEK